MSFKIADNLPEHVRRRLENLNAEKSADATDEPHEDFDDEAEEETGAEIPDGATAHVDDDVAPEAAEHETDSKTDNDIAAWKGRLKKEQEEKERYRIAAENGSFAAAKLLEMQEREKQREAELEQLRQERAQWQAKQEKSDDIFSDEEMQALSLDMGEEAAQIIAAKMRAMRQPQQNADIQALREQMQQREAYERASAWNTAIKEQIPEMQGLLQADKDFVAFLSEKKDFAGNSAMKMVQATAEHLDVSKIPSIRALIDEYQGLKSGDKTKRVATPRPNAGRVPVATGAKKRATQKEWNKRQELKTTGSQQAFREFLNKYDWSDYE